MEVNNLIVKIWGCDLYVVDLAKFLEATTADKDKAKVMSADEAQKTAQAVEGRIIRK
jgi:hypothetical protein